MGDGYNIVKLPTPPHTGKSLVPAKPNISALARRHGVSRQTIRRRLETGWQPSDTPTVEIIEPTQSVATSGHPHGRPVQRDGSYWRAAGRVATGLVIAGCGVAIAATRPRANAWFGRSLPTPAPARDNLSQLSVLAGLVPESHPP